MAIRAKSCSILGTFCFRIGSVIALAGARDLLAIDTKSGSFSKVFLWYYLRNTFFRRSFEKCVGPLVRPPEIELSF